VANHGSVARIMVRVMAEDPTGSPPRNRWRIGAVLAGLVVVTAAVGAVIAVLQRPPASPPVAPSPTLPRFPTFAPTPVPSGPVVGVGITVADDPAAHQVVVFGGVDSYDTTWLWNGNRWSLARPKASPPGRFGAGAAYDPATHLVMLYGGRLATGQVENDTWTWDGSTWREVYPGGGDEPPPGEGALMAWDAATNQMLLVTSPSSNEGNETWIWSGDHWVQANGGGLPNGVFSSGMTFDPVSNTLIFAGGIPPNGAGTSTWQWTGSSWHELAADIAAAPAGLAGLALDPSSHHLVLCATSPGVPAAQLWEWTGVRWMVLGDSQTPIAPEAETSDSASGQLLIFGSLTPPTQSSAPTLEVWSWTRDGWQQLGDGAA
jgi:hypothetical protein